MNLTNNTQIESFETALKRLEEIVAKLEGGMLSLEESLKIFEEGVNLTKFCQKELNEAEKKVELLMKDEHGSLKKIPFNLPSEEEKSS